MTHYPGSKAGSVVSRVVPQYSDAKIAPAHHLQCCSRFGTVTTMATHTHPPTNTQLIRSRDQVAELFPSETTSIFCGPDSKHPDAFCSGWQIPELQHQTTTGQLILGDWEHGGLIPWEPVKEISILTHIHTGTWAYKYTNQGTGHLVYSHADIALSTSCIFYTHTHTH